MTHEDEVKVTIRMPRTLRERLEREAKADQRSVNSLVNRILSSCDYQEYRRNPPLQSARSSVQPLDAVGVSPGGKGKVSIGQASMKGGGGKSQYGKSEKLVPRR